MKRRYRNLLPLLIHTEEGSYKQGEEFEKEFDSPADEAANLDSGLIEVVPSEYKVIGTSNVWGADPGETFTKALRIEEESTLVEGGHIELVEQKQKPKKKKED
jgi:hypothetical protein